MLNATTLQEYIIKNQVDGVIWKANRLLKGLDNPILRNDNVRLVAQTLSLIPEDKRVMRDDYAKRICKEHDLTLKTLEAMINEFLIIKQRKDNPKKHVRKNKVTKLDSDPKTFPFVIEKLKEDNSGETILATVKIDKYKFVQLLTSFGFTRYETAAVDTKEDYAFVMLKENLISSVTRNQIIDHLETFVKDEYDFEKAGYKHLDSETLINAFYDQIRTIFSKDIFARVRTEKPIIINRDKFNTTFLYFQNGFVEITKEGWKLRPYDEMDGSVWENQMLDRNFTYQEPEIEVDSDGNYLGSLPGKDGKAQNVMKAGYFADFCWKLSNDDKGRFLSLCSIIGYLMHDYYEYSLKAILLTDSGLSEDSEGRSGKTLLAKMIGKVRSYCDINGKAFDYTSETKYQQATMSTQVLHLNDVQNKGRFKFNFEDLFNDIVEGYEVKKLYMPKFRQFSKIILSTNKTLNIQGGSQRDRIGEYEVSGFFNDKNKVDNYYGQWFGRDWDSSEWNKFDNFMCFCASMFHNKGLLKPDTINLGLRKLINHTCIEFMDFMDEISLNLKSTGLPWIGYQKEGNDLFVTTCTITEWEFNMKVMKERFLLQNDDFKKWLNQNKFNQWMKMYAEHKFGVKKPLIRKSNGNQFFKFIESKPDIV